MEFDTLSGAASQPDAAHSLSPQDAEDVRLRVEAARAILSSVGGARTPLVLFDRALLRGQVALWRRHLEDVEPHFAVKACNAPAVLAEFNELGLSFDAATAGEIELLERLGVDSERVLCTHPIRDAADLAAIARYRPKALVVESASELRKLRRVGIPSRDYSPELFLRVELPFGGLSGKFGAEIARLDQRDDGSARWNVVSSPVRRIFEQAAAIEKETGARYAALGLTAHVGTNTWKTEKYEILLRVFEHLTERLATRGFQVTRWNLGGGYCDPELPLRQGTTQQAFLSELGRLVKEIARRHPEVKLLAEPGRFMVSNAGSVVVGVMQVDERTLLTEEDGSLQAVPHLKVQMNDGLYGNLLGERHDEKTWRFVPFRIGDKALPHAEEKLPAVLNGKTCDSWDRLDRLRPLPVDLRKGDALLVPHAGAYTLVTATDFNSAPRSQVCTYDSKVRGGDPRLYDANGGVVHGDAPSPDGGPTLSVSVHDRSLTPGASMHRALSEIVGSVAGRVDGGLLRPRTTRTDARWEAARKALYANDLELRIRTAVPLAILEHEFEFRLLREGDVRPVRLRLGKELLQGAAVSVFLERAQMLRDLDGEGRFPALLHAGILSEGGRPYALEEWVEGQSLEELGSTWHGPDVLGCGWRDAPRRAAIENLAEVVAACSVARARDFRYGHLEPSSILVPDSRHRPAMIRRWPLFAASVVDDGGDAGLVRLVRWLLTGTATVAGSSSPPDLDPELVSVLEAVQVGSADYGPEALQRDLLAFLGARVVRAHHDRLSPLSRWAYVRRCSKAGPGR